MTATVLAEYFVGRARGVVFVLRSDGAEPEAVELDAEPHEIESWVVSRLGPGAAGAAAGHLDASELDRIGAPLIAPVILTAARRRTCCGSSRTGRCIMFRSTR